MLLPASIVGMVWTMLAAVLWFLLLTLPLRLIIYFSKNYKIAIYARKAADWVMFFAILWLAYNLITVFSFLISSDSFVHTMQTGEVDPYRQMFLPMNFTLLLIMPLYIVLRQAAGRQEFFSDNHVSLLQYFILYLRSFKDDNKHARSERRLMRMLGGIFPPYAIGQPDEFMPPRGAKRIYVGDNWKEVVLELQQKAPLILQRINLSENYLWEFEQCVEHGHLQKVIFWVANYKEYNGFREYVKGEYELDLPELEAAKAPEQLFYMLADGSYHIVPLTNETSYQAFIAQHRADHPQLLEENYAYFFGHDHNLLREAFRWKYDERIMPGIDRWSWVGILFPRFYLICHPIRWRMPVFLFLALLFVIDGLFLPHLRDIVVSNYWWWVFILRWGLNILLVYAMGRNGRRLIWLSHLWESKEYYEKIYRRNIWITVILGVLFNAIWMIAGIGFFR